MFLDLNISRLLYSFSLVLALTFASTTSLAATNYHPLVYNVLVTVKNNFGDEIKPLSAFKNNVAVKTSLDRKLIYEIAAMYARATKSNARPLTAIKYSHTNGDEPLIEEDFTSLTTAIESFKQAKHIILAYVDEVSSLRIESLNDVRKLEEALAKLEAGKAELQKILDRRTED